MSKVNELQVADMPWLALPYQSLSQRFLDNKLAHALLVSGADGSGKQPLVSHFVGLMLCQSPIQHQPSGQCQSCAWYTASNHPDLQWINPESSGTKPSITVDIIRASIDFMQQSAHAATHKVLVINDAHAMNISAANALLKTLEEPPNHRKLILVTPSPQLLPATILSRCQNIKISTPPADEMIDWLMQHSGNTNELPLLTRLFDVGPLAYLHYLESEWQSDLIEICSSLAAVAEGRAKIVSEAKKLDKIGFAHMVSLMMIIVNLAAYHSVRPLELKAPKLVQGLQKLEHAIGQRALFQFYDRLIDMRRDLLANVHLNELLAIEQLLYGLGKLRAGKA